jgi:hypothetical protein
MQTDNPPFDPNEAVKVWAREPKHAYGRRLKFSERCNVMAALVEGARHVLIMKAFGLSRATVSQIATALNQGSQRYADVAREYRNLGPEEFRRRYYTEDLHWRLRRVANEAPAPGDIAVTHIGPDRRASKFSYPNYGVVSVTDRYHETHHYRIDWLRPKPEAAEGWYYAYCMDDRGTHDKSDPWTGRHLSDEDYQADPDAPDLQPCRTSSLAFDEIHDRHSVPSPRGGARHMGK